MKSDSASDEGSVLSNENVVGVSFSGLAHMSDMKTYVKVQSTCTVFCSSAHFNMHFTSFMLRN